MALIDRIKSAFSSHDSDIGVTVATDVVDVLTVIDQDEYEQARRDPAILALYERASQQTAEYEQSRSSTQQ